MTHFMDRDDPPETLAERVLRLHDAHQQATQRLDEARDDLDAARALERLRAEEYLDEREPDLPEDAPPDTPEALRDRFVLARRRKTDAEILVRARRDELTRAQDAFTEAVLALSKDPKERQRRTDEAIAEISAAVAKVQSRVWDLDLMLPGGGRAEIALRNPVFVADEYGRLRHHAAILDQLNDLSSLCRR
jgi:hypothetical protein